MVPNSASNTTQNDVTIYPAPLPTELTPVVGAKYMVVNNDATSYVGKVVTITAYDPITETTDTLDENGGLLHNVMDKALLAKTLKPLSPLTGTVGAAVPAPVAAPVAAPKPAKVMAPIPVPVPAPVTAPAPLVQLYKPLAGDHDVFHMALEFPVVAFASAFLAYQLACAFFFRNVPAVALCLAKDFLFFLEGVGVLSVCLGLRFFLAF